MTWLQPYMDNRWSFYRAMVSVSRQWRAITRHICLRRIIIDYAGDLRRYSRLVLEAKDEIRDDTELVEFFRKAHIRVNVDALYLRYQELPACRSLELTHQRARECNLSDQQQAHLKPWLQIPHLEIVTILRPFNHIEHVNSGIWLGHITHLRICSPQPLTQFAQYALSLEELTLDLQDPSTVSYAIVATLKAGIFRKPERKLVLNTGAAEPVCYGPVATTCERLGVVLERRVVYKDGSKGVDDIPYLDPYVPVPDQVPPYIRISFVVSVLVCLLICSLF